MTEHSDSQPVYGMTERVLRGLIGARGEQEGNERSAPERTAIEGRVGVLGSSRDANNGALRVELRRRRSGLAFGDLLGISFGVIETRRTIGARAGSTIVH